MDLELALKVIGWAFAGTPVLVFTIVSFYMIMGAAGDDDLIKALVMLGTAIFLIGTILLVVLYMTDLFSLI